MTLQERLRDPAHGFDRNESHSEDRYVCLCEHLANEAADAIDAQEKRIKELEGALRELMRVDEIGRDPNTNAESWRPLKRAAWERAREALK